MQKLSKKYIIGVDEAGRGAWAGPVCAGAFCVALDFDFGLLPGLTDSKKLTGEKREILFERITKLSLEGKCVYSFGESSAESIDQLGIREANRKAMEGALKNVLQEIATRDSAGDYHVLIDGRDNYIFSSIPREKVSYIVRGDLTEPVISAASIIAKVKRDRIMCDFSKESKEYGFHQHKGYGTKKHSEALLYYGIHPQHRKSYAPVKVLISDKP